MYSQLLPYNLPLKVSEITYLFVYKNLIARQNFEKTKKKNSLNVNVFRKSNFKIIHMKSITY